MAGLADSGARLVVVTCGVSSPQVTRSCSSAAAQLHHSKHGGEDIGREEFREKGKTKVEHAGHRSWLEGKMQAGEQVRTNHVSLSLAGGSKNSVALMHTQLFFIGENKT